MGELHSVIMILNPLRSLELLKTISQDLNAISSNYKNDYLDAIYQGFTVTEQEKLPFL